MAQIAVVSYGVSVSAPLFGWIALESVGERNLRPPALWLFLAGLFWMGLFASLAGNLVWGELGALGAEELVLLLRYGFWLMVFVGTAALTARGDLSGEADGAASEKQVLGQRRLTGVRVRNDGECPPAGGFFCGRK